ncbi:MAG: thiamine-phosphate kinase [Actinomycetota bacterium]|nr:thiamine-phosphate kinase [Actinomycetota bacterium]
MLRLNEVGEFGLINRLRNMLAVEAEGLPCGIGDDAVIVNTGQGLMVFTMDAMVEGVHFEMDYFSWHALGYKALAVNISDLAAMGASVPSFALVTLGLKDDTEVEAVEEMYRGMMECGESFSSVVVGGDVVRSPSHVFVSVALAGFLEDDGFLSRGGALPGQTILVTGTLGESHLGLCWLREGGSERNRCARRHLYPLPRVEEGGVALSAGSSACIDISDGLIRDLGHICYESGVGAELFLDSILVSGDARETARELGEDPQRAALYGGEDYELILVAGGESAAVLCEKLDATVVGRITTGDGVRILDSEGGEVKLSESGYEHFREG